jgi:hypothetical protein
VHSNPGVHRLTLLHGLRRGTLILLQRRVSQLHDEEHGVIGIPSQLQGDPTAPGIVPFEQMLLTQDPETQLVSVKHPINPSG